MSNKVESAFQLHHIQKCRDLVYSLMNEFYFDENITLKEILDKTKIEKDILIKIIDE